MSDPVDRRSASEEETEGADSAPVVDKTQEDIAAILELAKEAQLAAKQYNEALNVALAILSSHYTQPFSARRYISDRDLQALNVLLGEVFGPIANALVGGRKENPKLFADQLARINVMCINFFVERTQVATSTSDLLLDGVKYHVREENSLPYAVQVSPEEPKTKYHDQPLYQLLDAIRGDNTGKTQEIMDGIQRENEPEPASKQSSQGETE